MVKKITALVLLPAFWLFTTSCSSGLKQTVKKDVSKIDRTNSKLEIIGVVTKSGKIIEFRKKDPGRIFPSREAVAGNALQEITLEPGEIKRKTRDGKGKLLKIEALDGRTYDVSAATETDDAVTFSAYSPTEVPLADIRQVWIRNTNTGIVLGLVAGAALVMVLVFATMDTVPPLPPGDEGSCPFVYSWNGEEFVLDAEPYGAAISEGLKRTDWIELSELREVDGKYRVLLTNELDETQYTDEMKIAAVDHAPGAKIAADLAGGFHAFPHPLPPASAIDHNGRDIMPFVAGNDMAFWLSDLAAREAEGGGEFRDELVFEFPKPAGAKRAKLLANAWTTRWGSSSSRKFLELFGASLSEQYEDVDSHGPMYARFLDWMAREELYLLKVWVETPRGWKTRGMIMGGAPFITKDRACVLDVSDVPGEVLRIKLRPPVNFWMVNSLAVDYSETQAVRAAEISALKAVDHSGRDVKALLASTDNAYLESANAGEIAELVFPAPPLAPGLARTVFVKVSGYYKIHLDASGQPKTELIERVLGEPGFAARYSFGEYLKREAGVRAPRAADR